jgi:pilus assembly protein CpaE
MNERDLNAKRALSGATAIVRLSDIESRLKELDEKDAAEESLLDVPEETIDIDPASLITEGLSSQLGVSTKLNVEGGHCKIFAFFGAKGGAGTTSLSINVGGLLCALGHSVLLVDMDLQLGAAADSLGLSPQRSLAQIAQMIQDGVDVRDFPFAQHNSGLFLIDQPDMAELEALTAESLPMVFAAFRKRFDYVIIDGLRDFTDHAIVSLDQADRVAVVFSQDVPAIRGAIKSMGLFRRLGYGASSMTLVMNRYKSAESATLDAVEAALGARIDWFLPEDFDTAHAALNTGQLVVQSAPKSKMGIGVEDLGRSLAGMTRIERPKGFFSKLFGRG